MMMTMMMMVGWKLIILKFHTFLSRTFASCARITQIFHITLYHKFVARDVWDDDDGALWQVISS